MGLGITRKEISAPRGSNALPAGDPGLPETSAHARGRIRAVVVTLVGELSSIFGVRNVVLSIRRVLRISQL